MCDDLAGERMALKRGFRITEQDDIFFEYMPLLEQVENVVFLTRGNQFPILFLGKVLILGRSVKDDQMSMLPSGIPEAHFSSCTHLGNVHA